MKMFHLWYDSFNVLQHISTSKCLLLHLIKILQLTESCFLFLCSRSPISHHHLNSGDYITLRLAYTSGSNANYWLYCATTCVKYTCPGTIMTSSAWSSCSSHMMFKITARGKMDGQPINSGDTVSLSGKGYGTNYRLYCSTSSSYKCIVTS